MCWGGAAAVLGGAIWLLIWVYFLLTHGPTSSDYRNTFLGLSYYDSTKMVVFALALCIAGLVSLRVRRPGGARTAVGTVGYYLALTGLVGMMVGGIVAVWPIPWGETSAVLTNSMEYGFIAAVMGSLATFLGLTLFGIGLVRTKVLPAWTAAPLIIAGMAAVPYLDHTLHGVLIGLGWIMVGYAIWRAGPGAQEDSAP